MARRKPTTAAPPSPVPLAEVGPEVRAPWPVIDRYPILLGTAVTLQYVSNALRICTTGYRQPFVDLLDEFIERESHSQAMVTRRVQTIAGGRLAIDPAILPPDHPDKGLAREIADAVRARVLGLPCLPQRLSNLAWADVHGVGAVEARWGIDDGFWPTHLGFIHSRRLAYPDPTTWDLHLWDQGAVSGLGFVAPTQTQPGWGINITRDMPAGKFVVHTPQYRNSYPTREGLGRALLWLMAFKILGMRQGSQFIERFTKVLIWGKYTTANTGDPRQANDDEISKANSVVQALSAGNLTAAMLADSISINVDGPALKGSASTITVDGWINLCDQQITNLLLGNNLTTQPGKFGSKSSGEVGKEGEMQGAKFSADMLAASVERDLVRPCVSHNWPGREYLTPTVRLILDKPDPHAILELATKAADKGIPVDADAIAEQVGLPVLAPDNTAGRRMVPTKAVDPPPLDPTAEPEPVPAPAVEQDAAENDPQPADPGDDGEPEAKEVQARDAG